MLDFNFIRDEQPMHSKQVSFAGGIEWEEFEKAQAANIIESHHDFYGDFRWSSQNVKQKKAMLTPAITAEVSNLAAILKQAFAGNFGLVAFGD